MSALVTSLSSTRRRWAWVALFILLGLLAAWWLTREQGQADDLAGAQVRRGNIETLVTATGILRPRNYVDVGAQVSGQLKVLHVEVGAEVKAGDLLAEIDPTIYLARVDATRAQWRNQTAQLKDRQAQLSLAELQHRRQQNLLNEEATTEEAVQTAKAVLQSARAQLEALTAQIEQTESTLRAEEANLEYARIYAPMDGTVVAVLARQGQTLNASQQSPTLMQIADLATMTVQAQVSEADVARLSPGLPVYFTTLGSQGRRWHSQLYRIEPTPEVLNNVVLYNALFDVPNDEGQLLPQMTAQVFFVIAEARDALLIPVSALEAAPQPAGKPAGTTAPGGVRQAHSGRAQVQVVMPDGTLQPRQVDTGVSNRVQVEIKAGLTEGETVVTGVRSPPARGQQDAARMPRMMR